MQLKQLDLNKLHAFLAVVDRGGVTGAAGELARTPSAVSQSVSALERALGVKLFDRVGKQLVLTRGGRLLHDRFREYQAMLQRTVDVLVNPSGEVHGLVRIGVYLGFPRVRLTDFLTRFASRHPKVQLRVVYAPQDDLNARLLKNGLDFAVALRSRSDADPRLTSTRLFDEALVLVSGRRFFRKGFNVAELERTPVIDYYQSDPLIARWLAHHFGSAAAQPSIAIWAATTDLVLDLVLNHAGVGVLPSYVATPYLKRRQLLVLTTDEPELTDSIWLNELRGAYRDRTLEVFRDAVLQELAGTAIERDRR